MLPGGTPEENSFIARFRELGLREQCGNLIHVDTRRGLSDDAVEWPAKPPVLWLLELSVTRT